MIYMNSLENLHSEALKELSLREGNALELEVRLPWGARIGEESKPGEIGPLIRRLPLLEQECASIRWLFVEHLFTDPIDNHALKKILQDGVIHFRVVRVGTGSAD